MFNVFSKSKSSYYYGKESYRHVERLIDSGREILIISPYIDDYYASFISKRAHGKKFHILTSSIEVNAKKRITNSSSGIGLFAAIAIATGIFEFAIKLKPLFVILIPAMIMLSYLLIRPGRNSVDIKVPRKFVHAKLYVSEKNAVSGSANLTYSGMHKNMEHIEVTFDSDQVKKLRDEFWDAWNSA